MNTGHGSEKDDREMNGTLTYALITPARNEEEHIEKTIMSVISQSVLPGKWIIVSDGSTDGTDDIVKKYARDHTWIDVVRMPEIRERSFAAKVDCFNAGYERLKRQDYDIIGNLDADVSFGNDFFEYLVTKFDHDPALGVAGAAFREGNGIAYDYSYTNIEHVSGQCQLFRKQCFEEIGGYRPIRFGGIDWTAVTTARMKGWRTRTFTGRVFVHHRAMGTGQSGMLGACFRQGIKDYYLGNHPLWQVFRSAYQMVKRPYVIKGLFILSGYSCALVSREKRPIPEDLVRFTRNEQMSRLKAMLLRNGSGHAD